MRHRARALLMFGVGLAALLLLVVTLLRTGPPLARATRLIQEARSSAREQGPGPAPTPDGQGALSGVYDLLVHDGGENAGYYHCIASLRQDGVSNTIKTATQCYTDIALGDPNAEPAVAVGEGPNGLPGPPPPLPYLAGAPAIGGGDYDPGSDTLHLITCYPNMGGQLGPNVIADITVHHPGQQLASHGAMDGDISVHRRQGILQCAASTPAGPPDDVFAVRLHPVDDINGAGPNRPAAWRTLGDDDFDHDGCPDADELWGAPACGDDPYNPLDPGTSSPLVVSGNYTLLLTSTRADACWGGMSASGPCLFPDRSIIPGSYQNCLADLQQSGTTVAARMLCYIDDPNVVVNPQLAGDSDSNGVPDTSCPPAPASQCGDGLPGAAPPGAIDGSVLFADIDDRHFALNGQVDSQSGALSLAGCWQDRDGFASLGNVYLSIAIDAHTGHGEASLWSHQSSSACLAGAPSGTATPLPVDAARQATVAQARDTDSDGCPDARELGDDQRMGGLRDPMNSYDYPDMPTGQAAVRDHKIRVDDVTFVVNRYRHDRGGTVPPLYDSRADRVVVRGGNLWNLGPGDGRILVTDIVAVVNSYRHDCV